MLAAKKKVKPYAVYDWMRSVDLDVVCDELESLVAGDKELLYNRERFWIEHYRGIQGSLTSRTTEDYLLNHADGGGGAFGYKHTAKECERRKTQKGHWSGVTGEEHPAHGKRWSDERRKAYSDLKKGKMPDHLVGLPITDEARRKMSEAKLGTKASESARLRMSFTHHKRLHQDKIKTTCNWCLGADLQNEIQKRETEQNGNKMG